MKTEVFLREEQKFKNVEITGADKPEISDQFLNKWQEIINLIANITGVAAGLIMKITPETMEVVLKSQNNNNPYKVGGSDSLGRGLYCETVIGEKEDLYIKNALNNKAWEDNPDIDLDMISYYGLPLNWPDHEAFGTICVLDDSSMNLEQNSKKLLKEFKDVIQADLKLLTKQNDLKINKKAIETAIAGISFLDMEGKIFYVNNSFLKMSGHKKAEEIYNSNFTPLDLIPETEVDKIKKAFEITIEKGKWQGESKVLKATGEKIDIKISTNLVKDDNKQPVCMMASFEDITEKKEKEKEIKEQKNFLSTILDVQSGLVVLLDSEGKIVRFNNACEKLTGYTEDEVKGKKVWDLFIKFEEKEGVKNVFKQLKNKDYPNKYENYWLTKTGEEKLISWSNNIIIDNDNKIKYVVGTGIDITKRKNQELKITDQKNKLNWIIEGTDAGTWEWNIQTGKTFFNKKWAEMLGYKLEELEPTSIETWGKYTHPEDLKKAEKELEKHFSGESGQYDVEIRMKHKDGHWVWMNARGRVVSWTEDDEPIKMFGINLDITEKKEKEEKMKLLAASMENISDAVIITDINFKIEYINKSTQKLFGYSLEEIKGETPAFFNIKENVSETQQEIFEAVSNGNTYKDQVLNKRKDGSTFLCEVKANPIKNEEGEIYAYIGIHRDVTKKEKQNKFRKTLAEISSDLLNINSANIDRKINKSLEKIAKFFGVDRSYIIQLDKKNKLLSNTNEWCKKGVISEKENFQNIPSSLFPWSLEILTQNQHINIENVNEMPKKAEPEQSQLKNLGIKSLVIIPMFIENELFGFFIFDTVKNKRKFSDEEIRLLKIFTDTITNAFSKYLNDKKIRELTYKDGLTDLYNRRFFEEEMERVDTERQLPISIILGDINGLKIINDSLGHEKGDQLLKKSAQILKEAIRKEDILARQGGDEFAILLPKTEKEKAEKIIDRIKNKSRQTNNDELTVTMALGTSVKTDSDQKLEDVLRTADNDMYQNKLSESRSAKSRIINSLLHNLEAKSYETREHIERMKKLAFDFGKELGLSESELNRLSLLAKLHDIGKTTIDEKILKKSSNLNDAEWKKMKEHPEKGYQIASSSQKFSLVADEIFTHHERWDGKGYPRKLKGKNIPYLARIISIIDAYDVMTHDRPYSQAVSKEEALAEIKSCAGSQFDPKLTEEFIKMMKK